MSEFYLNLLDSYLNIIHYRITGSIVQENGGYSLSSSQPNPEQGKHLLEYYKNINSQKHKFKELVKKYKGDELKKHGSDLLSELFEKINKVILYDYDLIPAYEEKWDFSDELIYNDDPNKQPEELQDLYEAYDSPGNPIGKMGPGHVVGITKNRSRRAAFLPNIATIYAAPPKPVGFNLEEKHSDPNNGFFDYFSKISGESIVVLEKLVNIDKRLQDIMDKSSEEYKNLNSEKVSLSRIHKDNIQKISEDSERYTDSFLNKDEANYTKFIELRESFFKRMKDILDSRPRPNDDYIKQLEKSTPYITDAYSDISVATRKVVKVAEKFNPDDKIKLTNILTQANYNFDNIKNGYDQMHQNPDPKKLELYTLNTKVLGEKIKRLCSLVSYLCDIFTCKSEIGEDAEKYKDKMDCIDKYVDYKLLWSQFEETKLSEKVYTLFYLDEKIKSIKNFMPYNDKKEEKARRERAVEELNRKYNLSKTAYVDSIKKTHDWISANKKSQFNKTFFKLNEMYNEEAEDLDSLLKNKKNEIQQLENANSPIEYANGGGETNYSLKTSLMPSAKNLMKSYMTVIIYHCDSYPHLQVIKDQYIKILKQLDDSQKKFDKNEGEFELYQGVTKNEYFKKVIGFKFESFHKMVVPALSRNYFEIKIKKAFPDIESNLQKKGGVSWNPSSESHKPVNDFNYSYGQVPSVATFRVTDPSVHEIMSGSSESSCIIS